jgi:hypothetical protein
MVVTVRIVTEPAPGKDRRLFVAPGELRVEVAEIAAVRGHAFHGDTHLLHGVGVGGHVGEEHQHALLLLHREPLGHRQRHVRDEQPLQCRVRGVVHEHHRAREDTRVLEGRPEPPIGIEGQPQPAEHHHIGIGLHADAGEQRVVRLAGGGKYRDLLAFHEAVENVDHRHVGADHPRRQCAARRIRRRPADLHLRVVRQRRPAIHCPPVADKHPAHDIGREGHLRRMAEEARLRAGGEACGAREDLQRGLALVEAHDLRQPRRPARLAHQREVTEARTLGIATGLRRQRHPQHVADDGEHPVVVDCDHRHALGPPIVFLRGP